MDSYNVDASKGTSDDTYRLMMDMNQQQDPDTYSTDYQSMLLVSNSAKIHTKEPRERLNTINSYNTGRSTYNSWDPPPPPCSARTFASSIEERRSLQKAREEKTRSITPRKHRRPRTCPPMLVRKTGNTVGAVKLRYLTDKGEEVSAANLPSLKNRSKSAGGFRSPLSPPPTTRAPASRYKPEPQTIPDSPRSTVRIKSPQRRRKELSEDLVNRHVRKLADEIWDYNDFRKLLMTNIKGRRNAIYDEVVEELPPPPKRPEGELYALFRRKARVVRILCRVTMRMRGEFMLAKYVPMRADFHGEKLEFKVEDFKPSKELTVPANLVMIMEKLPEYRTQEDIELVRALMRRNLPSFRKYNEDMQRLMCKIVSHITCRKNHVILRKGHIGYAMYFINSGEVTIHLETEEDSAFVRKKIVTLRKGSCFGEVAILQDALRSATVISSAELSDFMVVNKDELIDNGLHRQIQAENIIRYQFFRTWPLLQDAKEEALRELANFSRTFDFNHHKVVVKDTSQNTDLWFIIKGRCQVMRFIGRLPKDYLHEFSKDAFFRNNQVKLLNALMKLNRTGRKVSTLLGKEIVCEVDILRQGACFGIDALRRVVKEGKYQEPVIESQTFAVVSCGCVAVHVPAGNFFRMFGDTEILGNVLDMEKHYPEDDQLLRRIYLIDKWTNYRKSVVAEVMYKKETDVAFEKRLRAKKEEIIWEEFMVNRPKSRRAKSAFVPKVTCKPVQMPRPWTCISRDNSTVITELI